VSGRVSVSAVGAFGALLLMVSAGLPWFHVPESAVDDSVSGGEAPVSVAFRVLCLVAAVGLPLLVHRPAAARAAGAGGTAGAGRCAGLLALLLLFPYAVMIGCPATSAKAGWLHVQHQSLTWFGGDIFGLQELKEVDWKGHASAAELLDRSTAMSVPAMRPSMVPFGSLQDLLQWLGYSNEFCQFVGAGWAVALAGSVLLLLASCRGRDEVHRHLLGAAARTFVACSTAGVVLALLPIGFAAFELDRARDAAQRGQPGVALERIELASRVLPAVRESSDLALQRGLLQAGLRLETPEAMLYRARVLQSEDRLEQADSVFGALLVSGPSEGPVHREAIRGILRRGIRQLNAGETTLAVESLEDVLRTDPCNVKASYVLQLAYLRAARFESMRKLVRRMRDTYRYFNSDTKVPILAAAQENVAYAAYLENDPLGAHMAWKTLGDARLLTEE
jgi:hypothetical protein